MTKMDIILGVTVKDGDDVTKLNKNLKDLGKSGKDAAPKLNAAGKATLDFGGAVKGLVAGGVLAAAGRALLDFGKQAITAASDVEEMQSKFNTVFKDLSGDVTQQLEEFADAANRSVFDLQGFAATLQDTFVPLGYARDQAADMSVQLVKLAEDLASFNNLNTEDVIRDLQSAMVGNTETLLKYGVVANQAALDQEALALGLDFTKGAMDGQTKAAATLSLVMKGTTDAQGDAINTADSYANVSKGLDAAIKDLSTSIGQNLIPAMTEAKKEATGLISSFSNWVKGNNAINQAVSDGIITQREANRLIDKVALTSYTAADAQEFLSEKYEQAAKELEDMAASAVGADKVLSNYAATTQEVAESFQLLDANSRSVESRILQLGGSISMSSQEAEELAYATGELGDSEERLQQNIDAVNDRLTKQTEAEELAAEAAAELARVQAELAAQSGDLFTRFSESGAAAFDMNESLYAAADASGASAEQLALLKIATGELTDAQAEALLKQVAIQQSVERLGEAYASGGISLQEYVNQAKAQVDEINNLDFSFNLEEGAVVIPDVAAETASIDAANERLAVAEEKVVAMGVAAETTSAQSASLDESALALTETISQTGIAFDDGSLSISEFESNMMNAGATVNNTATSVGALTQEVWSLNAAIDQVNSRTVRPGVADGVGGSANPDAAFASGTGGQFFTVPPGYPNDSYMVGLTSGEEIMVIPRGGGDTINNNNSRQSNVFNISAGTPREAVDPFNQALRESGIRGFG